MKIICIIPIHNEELRLNELLTKINEYSEINKFNIDFLLINSGSKDNSLNIIKKYKFNYISLKKNKGVGYVFLIGLKIAKKLNYDVMIQMAGNNKMSPYDIDSMIRPILENNIDYVSGTRFRFKKNYENNPKFRIFAIKILSFLFSKIFGKKTTDATCGFRAFKIKKVYPYFKYFNKKKNYTYGYEYYSYGKILLSDEISSCEADVKMNYPKKGKYSKIRPVIDWFPMILGYLNAFFEKKK